MDIESKRKQLAIYIENKLKPLINHDYVLLDVPYYNNIGDVLIWNGTEVFLKSIPYKCLFRCSFWTYKKRHLSKDVIILLQGGGNFGDVWTEHQTFRKRIINDYPNNKIIILPQTVFYEDDMNLKLDAALFGKHKNLTICTRDKHSHNVVKDYFSNEVIMLPDMAFFLNVTKTPDSNRILYLKRNDAEAPNYDLKIKEIDVECHDWPTYERNYKMISIIYYLHKLSDISGERIKSYIYKIIDYIEYNYIRYYIERIGRSFIENYSIIYSTRLHVAILGVLSNKNIKFIDNSYGKNKNFFYSWLENLDNIELIK